MCHKMISGSSVTGIKLKQLFNSKKIVMKQFEPQNMLLGSWLTYMLSTDIGAL